MDTIKLAESFLAYCRANPSERFWQALRNWSCFSFIGVSDDRLNWADTFYYSNDCVTEQK